MEVGKIEIKEFIYSTNIEHLTNVDLKQRDCQIFLQQRWIYCRSAENCNSGSATMVSHMWGLAGQGKETAFIEEKEVRRAIVNKQSVAFHWLSPCWERRGVFLLPVGLCCPHRVWELPLLVSGLYLIEVSVY